MAGVQNIRWKWEGLKETKKAVWAAHESTRDAEKGGRIEGDAAVTYLIQKIRENVSKDVLARSEGDAAEVAAIVLSGIEDIIPGFEPDISPEQRWKRIKSVFSKQKKERKKKKRETNHSHSES